MASPRQQITNHLQSGCGQSHDLFKFRNFSPLSEMNGAIHFKYFTQND